LLGGRGQDLLEGGGGNDTIGGFGSGEPEGDDTLNGGSGNDVLNDCTGHNRLDAGSGQDICQFDTRESRARNCEDTFACECASATIRVTCACGDLLRLVARAVCTPAISFRCGC